MMDKLRQQQTDLNYEKRIITPFNLYSNGLIYFSVFMKGLSQMGIYLLNNYGQPGSFTSPYYKYNESLKLPAQPHEPSTGNLLKGNTTLNSPGDVLSSVKRITENYFLKNAPSVLNTLLEFICLAYSSNFELRKHIRNIHAKYHFSFGDNETQISLEIKNGGMRVFPGIIDMPDASLKFRDSNALGKLFFSEKPDILEVILKQDVVVDGNIIYIFKFIYLVRHLQLRLTGQA